MKSLTFGYLVADSPFGNIFPDGEVPLVSILPIVPGAHGNPNCYVVDAQFLTSNQVEDLALLLAQSNCDTAEHSLDELKQYVLEGLPLRASWFRGVSTSDPVELGLLY